MPEQVVDGAELVDQFSSCFLSDTRTAWEIVCRVTHQCQKVDYLGWGRNAILRFHFFFTQRLIAASMTWTEHKDPRPNQLPVVFVWGKHESIDSIGTEPGGNGSDDIIGFEAVYLQNRDAHRLENLLDDGN